jgi:hypothetical protein
MKVAEILRKIADDLEDQEHGDLANNSAVHAELNPVGVDWSEGDGKDDESDGTAMIPPLQQKLELLKKTAGVDSAFDNELDDIKKLTGIEAVIHQIDDTELDGQ